MSHKNSFYVLINVITDSDESGKNKLVAQSGNQMRMEQLHTGETTEVCGIRPKCIHIRPGVYKK